MEEWMRLILILTLLTFFTACDLLQSDADKAKRVEAQKQAFEKSVAQSKEIQLKKLSLEQEKELALLNSKKELATIEKEKEIEKIRLQSELEKQKIILQQQTQERLIQGKIQKIAQADSMELKRYLVITFSLLALMSAFFVFYYFKKKREDKLRAYNDNLEKYFQHKENETRVKIAEKMLDVLASGHLDKQQEEQLISAFSGQITTTQRDEVELIEELSHKK